MQLACKIMDLLGRL